MQITSQMASEHVEVTRRYFLRLGAAGMAALSSWPLWAQAGESAVEEKENTELAAAVAKLEYLTRPEDFGTVERGNPLPYTLPEEKLREVGLLRDTWQLEVLADPDSNTVIERPMTKELGTALNWDGLMKLAERHAVRFLKVMTCNNGNSPLGMGLWEGVPLRTLIWETRPTANLRRVFYYGYHNDDPQQRFQSSLSIGRVLEDPPGDHPVIVCYKLNGQWLSGKRGGPARILVPDAYGFKSVKWLQRIMLTNNHQANDTYAAGNNDIDSWMKTFARFIRPPSRVKAGQPTPLTGVAQVGVSGLSKVQYCLMPHEREADPDDPYFTKADWRDAVILPPPKQWSGGLPDDKLPPTPRQIDSATGQPLSWPLRYTIVHWAALISGLDAGKYFLRCRTIDANGIAQPLPRPLPKSGRNAIEQVTLTVEQA